MIALCFIVSYDSGCLSKEEIWKKWISEHKDKINIYVHYKNFNELSPFLKQYAIPKDFIVDTNYFHMVPAYISILNYAFHHNINNTHFCILTESCIPIKSPNYFFDKIKSENNKSIFKYGYANWNVDMHRRSNLRKLPKHLQLMNDPWIILSRNHVFLCIKFIKEHNIMFRTVCNGGIANESIFAIILKVYGELDNVINKSSNLSDWSRMESSTSPHLFVSPTSDEIKFLKDNCDELTFFARKFSSSFPDNIITMFWRLETKM